jgi:hypothetical protein
MRYCPVCRAEYAPGTETCHDCEVELVDLLVDDGPGGPDDGPRGPLVTIATFDTPIKASILASRLEAEGIACRMDDAETIAAHGMLSAALGGVKVQVSQQDARRAVDVARQIQPLGAPRVCPACGSTRVTRKGLSFLLAALAVLTLGVLSLFFPPRWTCEACHHRWH